MLEKRTKESVIPLSSVLLVMLGLAACASDYALESVPARSGRGVAWHYRTGVPGPCTGTGLESDCGAIKHFTVVPIVLYASDVLDPNSPWTEADLWHDAWAVSNAMLDIRDYWNDRFGETFRVFPTLLVEGTLPSSRYDRDLELPLTEELEMRGFPTDAARTAPYVAAIFFRGKDETDGRGEVPYGSWFETAPGGRTVQAPWLLDVLRGRRDYHTGEEARGAVAHELGHAFGLLHPGEPYPDDIHPGVSTLPEGYDLSDTFMSANYVAFPCVGLFDEEYQRIKAMRSEYFADPDLEPSLHFLGNEVRVVESYMDGVHATACPE